MVLTAFLLTIHKRTRVPDKETWLEWTGRYRWEEKEKITAEHDVYCDPTEDRVSVYVLKMQIIVATCASSSLWNITSVWINKRLVTSATCFFLTLAVRPPCLLIRELGSATPTHAKRGVSLGQVTADLTYKPFSVWTHYCFIFINACLGKW